MGRDVIRIVVLSVAVVAIVAASAQATHPRPKGATPLRMPLVPSYAPCTAPNRTHGPPLAFASCNPPAQTSAQATVGTPDAFGGAAHSTGFVRLIMWCCGQAPGDIDVLVDVAVGDVRCVPTGTRCGAANASGPADYAGEMRSSFRFRITDHWNAITSGGGPDAATVQDLTIDTPGEWTFCAQSASTSTGSSCTLATSFNAVVPGSVKEVKRAIWELEGVQIYDGGADGDANTIADNTPFARPGVFIP